MSPLRITTSPGRTRRRADPAPVLDHADARSVDEHAVALAAVDDLGVAGHEPHPGGVAASRIDATTRRSVRQRQAFLEDEARAEIERAGAAHGEVVDRAVHRQRADVAARERRAAARRRSRS